MKKTLRGFTLIELMITISLAAILVTVGVPSFNGLIERNQLTSNINQFVSSLSVARSEAIKRKEIVALCASADGETCSPGSGFENGWIIYVESVAPRNVRDVNNEDLIWVQEALPNGITLTNDSSSNSFLYRSTGRISGGAARVVLCKDAQTDKARALTINTTGRVHQAEMSANGIPIVSGNEIEDCG